MECIKDLESSGYLSAFKKQNESKKCKDTTPIDFVNNSREEEMLICDSNKDSEFNKKESDMSRFFAWKNLTHCPECNGCVFFKFYDSSKDMYYIKCDSIPSHVFKELECMCKGTEYTIPVRMVKNGDTPLSQTVSSVEEYIEKIQDQLCQWYIRL